MARVVLNGVSKVFPGGVLAVDKTDLEIRDREFVVLVGPSGCGKSTTLRMIAGLEEITEGTITIDDKVVNDVPPKDRDIAMVFQNYALYPHMTVFDNMAFGLKLRKYPKKDIRARVEEAAGMLGIGELLGRRPKALSGGQRQRVALGRAIVRHPKVFLFDEPLSNLDAKMRVQMRIEISRLHSRMSTTMIYVTHDQVEAMTMGDRIVVMCDGLIQQVAEPLDLYNKPVNRFVAGFIGSPPMNFITGKTTRRDGRFHFSNGSVNLRVDDLHAEALASFDGKEVVFGIRPEDLAVAQGEVAPDQCLNAKVDVVEPMGAEMVLHLVCGAHDLTASVKPDHSIRESQSRDLVVDMQKAHFFDPSSDEALV